MITGRDNETAVAFSPNLILNTTASMHRRDTSTSTAYDNVANPTGTFNLWVERNLIWGVLNLGRADTTSRYNHASATTNIGYGDWPTKSFPASLVYTSKPSWWTISSPWPAIGADVDTIGGTMHKLPAQCRYEGSVTGDCAPYGAPPALRFVPVRRNP